MAQTNGGSAPADDGFSFTGFLGGLFDSARGVFDTIADIEIGRADVELEKERRRAAERELQQGFVGTVASEDQGVFLTETGSSGSSGGGGGLFGFSQGPLLQFALIAAGVLLILRLSK